MRSIRVNISVPEDVFTEISRHVGPRKRSRFITEAVKHFLKERKERKLAAEYQEASAEIRRINHELEGAMSDGLD